MAEWVAGIPVPVGDAYKGEPKGLALNWQLQRLRDELVNVEMRRWALAHEGPFGFYFTGHTYDLTEPDPVDGVQYAENIDFSTRFVQVECFHCFETHDCV